MRFLTALLLCLVIVAVPSLSAAQQPHAITLADRFALKEVEDPQISPDGKFVAYTVTSNLMDQDKTEARIWMVPFSGGDEIPLTSEGVSSSHPRWSPDGRYIAFLSARNEGKTQLWLLNRSGGEAQRLTNTPQDVEDFEWSPDGRRLCLLLRDATPEEIEAARDRDEQGKDSDEDQAATDKPRRKNKKAQKP